MKAINIVIVGLNFGRHIVEGLTKDGGNPHVCLAGLCDLDRAKAEELSSVHGKIKVYDSLDEVLADPNITAVGLYTGPNGRAEILRKIINAGKDVMTTKPFENNPAAAIAVLEEAARIGRVIHLNSPNPGASPDLELIQQWHEKYDLGNPIAARADVWTHYREEADGGWYDDPEKCPVAPIFRLGIYLINDMVQLFGRAHCVNVMGTHLFTGRPTPDNAQLGIKFENGALVNIFASFCVRDGDHYRNSLTLNYERGTVYRNVGPIRNTDATELNVIVNDDVWKPRRIADSATTQTNSGLYDWAGFAAAIRGDADAPSYKIENIVEPLRIIVAMTAAERTGKIENIKR